jgi:hypothetical protein
MKRIIPIFILFMATILAQAQNPNFEWVKSNQGYQGDANAKSIELDSAGNIYTIGSFSGTVDFNPSSSNATWLSSPLVGYSYYIQKLDSVGSLVWVRSVDIVSGSIRKIDIDPTGRLYIIGNFEDSIDIDPGIGVHKLYSNGGSDAFVLKLSANGNFIWAKSFGGLEDDVASDMVTDSQGNVYTHGSYKDTVDFDPGSGTCIFGAGWTPHPGNTPLYNAFIQKLDKNGNFIWAKVFLNSESGGGSRGEAIDLDSYGNVYCTGYISLSGVDFDPGAGIVQPPSNHSSMYFVKLDSIGSFIWARFSTGVGPLGYGALSVKSLSIDRFDNVYTTGLISGYVDFNPDPDTLLLTESTFIQKYDQNGNFLWAKSYGYEDNPMSLASDTFGNVYTIGDFQDSTDIDPSSNSLVFYAQGAGTSGYGAYFQKLNSTGNLLMAGIIQANAGVSNWSRGRDIKINTKGDIFATGDYGGTVDFDISSGIYNQTSINNRAATYILKLSQCQTITTDYQSTCDSLTWMDGVTYYKSTNSAYFTLPSVQQVAIRLFALTLLCLR